MIYLTDLIFESKKPQTDNDISKIKKECSEYIKTFKEDPVILYRGNQDEVINYKFYGYRKNRKPLNTPKAIDTIIEEIRLNSYSDKISRREATFVTPSDNMARRFGSYLLVFIPCNGYEYMFNKDIKDMYMNIDNYVEKLIENKNIKNLSDLYTAIDEYNSTGEEDDYDSVIILQDFLDFLNSYWENMESGDYWDHEGEILFKCLNGFYLVESKFFDRIMQ